MLEMGLYKFCLLMKWKLLCFIIPSWQIISARIHYAIPEELNAGAFVGNIAEDLNLNVKQLSVRSFQIMPGPGKQYIDVNLDNGVLLVKEKIDREQLCEQSLACTLSLQAVIENPLNVYHFQVDILDVNDNAPKFPESEFRLEILEVAAPGTRFALECAQDTDIGTNSVQSYQLIENGYFSLDVETLGGDGKVPVLILERSLDREKESAHKLVLIANDGGIPRKSGSAEILIVVEDANDNAPVFSQSVYRVSLWENAPKGTLVIKLDASDPDADLNGKVVYSFGSHTSSRVREIFQLDSKTGEIRIKNNLDYEKNSVFEINVQAKDQGPHATPVYCHVVVKIVDVNDNAPVITLTSLFSPIGEDSPPGTVVALISTTDKDSAKNGDLDCEITKELPFKLESSSRNYYSLIAQERLDREQVSAYNVTVVCTDAGVPPLTSNKTILVEVSDINDNPPQFTQPVYTAYVMENNAIGASIFTVTAFDQDLNRNADVSYFILESQIQGMSVSAYVSINSLSGVIFSQRSFDFENLKHFQILVQTRDSGSPPLSGNASVDIIILDQNDNAPVIVQPLPEFGSTVSETISRLAEPGYLVTKVSATDGDSGQNARLTYQILQATEVGLFTISPDTGEIWTIRSISKNDAAKQRLVICVKDDGSPPLTATVTIILSLVGNDGQLLSELNGLSADPGFASDTSFYLVIALGVTSSVFLVILIILAVMVHRSSSLGACGCFTVRNSLHGFQRGKRTLQIPPNYVEVFGGDPLSQSFRYNSCSSSHSVKRDFRLSSSRSTRKDFTPGGILGNGDTFQTSKSAQYRNTLNEIRYSIPEELNAGAFVGNIAEDLNLNIKELSARGFQIMPGPSKRYFDVNVDNGVLFVREKIDREQLCERNLACTLSVEAVIQNPVSVYHFQVDVLDVNDNAPRFPDSRFSMEISEVAAPGTHFALECAQDPDVGSNSVQSYQLVENLYFTLDVQKRVGGEKLPVLVLERQLDREKESTHRLVLIAKDGGVPERSGTAEILIVVEDANDNAPIFPQPAYRISLRENTPKGTLVIKLHATDLDAGVNGQVLYSFSSHTSNRVREMFGLDSKSGEIRIKNNLDYEENRVFEINVQAKDQGPYATPVYCHVVVNIVDMNDNAPVITLTSSFSPIREDSLQGTVVALISSTDKDSVENGDLDCEITKELPFKLQLSSRNYYSLVTQERLDREHVSAYNVTVVCTDAGVPPLTSNRTILVEVSDINDNSPQFTQPVYTAYVMENNAIGTSIFTVTAFDQDLNRNADVSYFILESQIQGMSVSAYVSINSLSGVMFSQRSFDFENLKHFQILVQARDSGSPPLSGNASVDVIILDQNDNAPVIVQPLPEFGSTVSETISRLAEPGYLVTKVSATDSDTGQNARLTYQILRATEVGLFTISPDTGEIWTIRSISKNDAAKQRLVICVKDDGSPPLTATVTIILSLVGSDAQLLSDLNGLSEDPGFASDTSFYLVIALGVTSSVFLVILIILAVKVHRSSSLGACGCFTVRNSLHGFQRGNRTLQIPPNYVEVFGGDPLSQSFRYDSCSSSHSVKRDFRFSSSGAMRKDFTPGGILGNGDTLQTSKSAQYRNTLNEVRLHFVSEKNTSSVSIGTGIIQRHCVVLNPWKCFVLQMEFYKLYLLMKWKLLYFIIPSWQAISGQIRYSIPEELNAGAFVGNIAEDLKLNIKELSARGFQIMPGPSKRYFDVNVDNGVLFVREKIDREQLCERNLACTLSVEAVIQNPVSVYHFQVDVLDVNDNAPRFPDSRFSMEISEVAAPGTHFALECAQDPDVGSNSVQSYQLVENLYFTLDVQNRVGGEKLPVLVLGRQLDREKESTHRVELVAKDGGVPERSGTAEILIVVEDANDNAPVFPQPAYRISLRENSPKGKLVIKLHATDLDAGVNGQVLYSFSSHTSNRVREMFGLDSKSGEIRIKNNLDYEENSVFEINVQAKDQGPNATPVYCHVVVNIVDMNDNAPVITLTSSFSPIREDSLPGTVVALISSTDKDSAENGDLDCEITKELPFKLESSSRNYYSLVTQERLDREHLSAYNVTVLCTDAGVPPLTSNKTILVEVSDINDNSPQFIQPVYTAYVMENNAIGTSIFTVTAFDQDLNRNADVSYFISESQIQGMSVSAYVSINSLSGVIFSQRSFDFENLKHFKILVQARDSGSPPLSGNASVDVIILDQNDNAPVIVQPLPEIGSTVSETISRLAEPGYLVTKVSATDGDSGQNARLTYQILRATEVGLFTISPDTGEIWTIRSISKNDAAKQRLVICVKDDGSPPLTATVTIILSLVGNDEQLLSKLNSLSEDPEIAFDTSFYLVIVLGVTSSVLLMILIILAVKVHRSSSLGACGCFAVRNSLHGFQRGKRTLQIPPNYVEVFGGDPLSQSFRYDSCSSSHSVKRDFRLSSSRSTRKDFTPSGILGNGDTLQSANTAQCKNTVNNEIRYSIPEELNVGAFVGNIAEDLNLDIKELPSRGFQIVPGPSKQYIDVNLNSGVLVVKETMDRELLCEQSLACTLSLEAVIQNPLNMYHFQVDVMDVNDNAPSFPESRFKLEISEVAAPETRFALKCAQDPDVGSNSVQSYQLLENGYFSLDVETRGGSEKLPVLVLERQLDREKESTHRLVLIAADGGVPERSGTAEILIVVEDANDNAPVFPKPLYRVSLPENAPKGTLVIKLDATDLDAGVNGQILYSFSSHTSNRVREMFGLDSKSGEIRIKNNLDYEENRVFEINVQAKDQGPNATPVYCHVVVNIVDENDNAPMITLTSLFSPIGEDSPPGTVVALISSTDKDSAKNGDLDCEIPKDLPFKLVSSLQKYYKLVIWERLDREHVSAYNVTVVCTDAGVPPLTSNKTILVEVSDINDNPPQFTQPVYTAYVMENNAIGASIFTVTAFDQDLNRNADVSYFILESQIQGMSVSAYVSINSLSGVIFSQRSFDFENLKNFQILVQARDSGSPPLSGNASVDVIILDQNDNAPVIVQPLPEFGSTVSETISRLAEPGYLVTKVSATDGDSGQNARLTYQILQATEVGLFTISPDTGEIWTIRSISKNDAVNQRLVICVKDNGSPPLTATVTIILSLVGNDGQLLSELNGLSEDPGFASDTSFYLVIALGVTSSVFLVILIILAIKVHRSSSLGACGCFTVRNSLHGFQRGKRTLQIPPNYVEVFGGDPLSQSFRYDSCSSSHSVKRDFRFSSSGAMRKDFTPGGILGNGDTLQTSKSAQYRNTLNERSGEWRVALKSLQCFVQEMGYSNFYWLFTWSICYCMLSSWVLVSGQVRYSVSEELQLGAFVGNIADDLDLDVNELTARSFRIVSSPRKQYLDVNLDSGILYVKGKIDREQICGSNSACILFLEAVIEDPLTVYHFQVEILDVNDNAPSFPKAQFRLEISEVAAQGTRFALESAYDPDVGINSVQTYQLGENEHFTVDIQSRRGDGKLPVLVLQRLLDREKQKIHRLVLVAKDGGIPEKSGTAQIIVTVQDANDNAPVFQQSEYRTRLFENTPKGTLVIKLNATDLDEGSNGEVVYSFSSHASNRVREMFSLDSRTGEIRVKDNLDYEQNDIFEINVQATDKGSVATPVYCEVLLDVIDINDNAPEATLTSIFSPVSEEALPGTVVALFNVNDQDSGDNGQVHCQILSGSPFKLDSSLRNYYRILTEQRLDRENIAKYDVTIVCSDKGSPPLTSKKSIRVDISDVNDNAPRFMQPSYTAYVTENNVIGSSIFSVTATDEDVNQNSQLSYSILETRDQVFPVSAYVNINSETGVIYAQKSFDYEQLKSFEICVRAQDSGPVSLSSNVSVDVIILDQNDNAPVIVHPLPEHGSTVTETVSSSAEPGYLVTKVSAIDTDSGQNARLTYQISQATTPGLFTISSDSGDIWTTRGIVDRDLRKQRLLIVVKDSGEPALSATLTIIISLEQGYSESLSEVDSLSEEAVLAPDASFYLVMALGLLSVVFLIIVVVLAIKVNQNRWGFDDRNSCCRRRSRKTCRSIQIPPNYVEVFGGDPLSQSFRYDSCSSSHTTKGDFMFRNTCSSLASKNNETPPISNSESCRNFIQVRSLSKGNRLIYIHVKIVTGGKEKRDPLSPEMGYCRIYCLKKWFLLYCLFFWSLVSGQIRYSIPEELQLGAFVGNIADDLGLDVKELTARNFRIAPGLGKKYLDVNLDNGILFVKEKIDREQLCGSSLTCLLSMEAVIENPLNVYRVEVEVLDINDNAPIFPKNQVRLEIYEVATPGARFPLECAYDSDVGTNSLQDYRLVENQYFALDIETRSGEEKLPVLTLERALDREKEATHRLQLIAKDGGIPPRSSTAEILVTVQDANDNSPVFAQSVYRVSLNENVPKGTLVIKLNATDLDDGSNGELEYSFTSHTSATVREMFDLNSITGEVKVKGILDYEVNRAFEINIQAMDKGFAPQPAYCRVHVDITDLNDNAPEVKVTSLFSPLAEDSSLGVVIALISTTDKDSGKNGEIHCQIPNNLPFKLDSSLINYYKLLTVDQLDRENIPKYDVTIECSDSGSTPLTSEKTMQVEISDVNDNAPRFSQSSYTAYVMENNVIGASILSVTAIDPDLKQNAEVSYSITQNQLRGESIANCVYINSENGIVFSQRSFDYEELKGFQFQVQARDNGSPPLTSNVSVEIVILDQNDNAPVIVHPLPEHESTVMETMSRSAEPGYLVTKVSAIDADSGQNARLSYQIVQSTDPGLFTISPDTGEVWTIRAMEEKDATKQKLTIVVKDNGTPPLSASLTISLSVVDGDAQLLSGVTDLDEKAAFKSVLSFYLVISLGAISSIFLLILIILAVKVHKSRSGFGVYGWYGDICWCYQSGRSLNGIQKASRNIQIPPNYVEVFGGDPLSQSFRYGTNSTIGSTKRDSPFPNTHSLTAVTYKSGGRPNEKYKYLQTQAPEHCRNSVNNEVKQPNTDWRFSQTHRAELNSSQYLEEEGVQREIQCEVQREVQRDVQREVQRDVQCDVPRNIQRDLQRDAHSDVQHVAENDPGGPRKAVCARPPAIPAGRDGWTLPRTAPRMQLQMALGTHVPGTLRSQYLFPRESRTSGARISNSSVEFTAFPVGSLHGPWAVNQTRDRRGITRPGSWRPELDTEARCEISCSPSSLRLSTQRLHSGDHHHPLRQVNN
ncbi:uncharacterized protein LOC132405255 [Hypanus sabinus]|uniref:uncharacterized protein LOC132405255 n=1 Tax=Hypanus sabinus TaxID=79690 RepID=UPI0028C488E5|nr:uncharacterized protein LOC132405255 [Hypanus sabinus]